MSEQTNRGESVAADLNRDFLSGELGRYFRSRAMAWMVQPELASNDDGDFAPGLLGQVRPGIKSSAGKNKGNGAAGHVNRYLVRVLGPTPRQARYADLGADFYDSRRSTTTKKRQHVRELEALGYRVTLEPAA
jgi:hypothetical protein